MRFFFLGGGFIRPEGSSFFFTLFLLFFFYLLFLSYVLICQLYFLGFLCLDSLWHLRFDHEPVRMMRKMAVDLFFLSYDGRCGVRVGNLQEK